MRSWISLNQSRYQRCLFDIFYRCKLGTYSRTQQICKCRSCWYFNFVVFSIYPLSRCLTAGPCIIKWLICTCTVFSFSTHAVMVMTWIGTRGLRTLKIEMVRRIRDRTDVCSDAKTFGSSEEHECHSYHYSLRASSILCFPRYTQSVGVWKIFSKEGRFMYNPYMTTIQF